MATVTRFPRPRAFLSLCGGGLIDRRLQVPRYSGAQRLYAGTFAWPWVLRAEAVQVASLSTALPSRLRHNVPSALFQNRVCAALAAANAAPCGPGAAPDLFQHEAAYGGGSAGGGAPPGAAGAGAWVGARSRRSGDWHSRRSQETWQNTLSPWSSQVPGLEWFVRGPDGQPVSRRSSAAGGGFITSGSHDE